MSGIIPADLDYLVFNRVALRFQHAADDAAMRQNGFIAGDAYSISAPRFWYPATAEKASEFVRCLKTLVGKVFTGQMVNGKSYDGSFLLIKDVAGARTPVVGRSYEAPFLTVGAFTKFEMKNVAGRVDISRAVVMERYGFSPAREDDTAGKIVEFLTVGVIGAIRAARLEQPSNALNMKVDGDTIMRTRHAMAVVSHRRVAAGLPPLPPSVV